MSTVYLPVTARLNLTSEQRALGISQELYNLKVPKHLHEPGRVTTQLLGLIQHPTTGQWACVGDTDLAIAVHPERDLNALVALFPQLTTEERSAMTYYIATNEVVYFQYLMPSDAEQLTQEEAEAAGWFGDSL
jgi:hypothetical protein